MKKKRMVTALLTTAMVFGAVPTAFAADNITVTVDGQKVSFGDQQPVNINGRVMVPVRAVAEKMGWDVEWFTYYGNTVVDGQFQQEHDIVLKNIVKKSDTYWAGYQTNINIEHQTRSSRIDGKTPYQTKEAPVTVPIATINGRTLLGIRDITNALLPIQQKYNALNQEQRYQFRKLCRTFVKWYGYITQIARMFDKQMHNEYIFCSYLAKVIPADPSVPFALGDRVKLEYYNLEKTFEGSIDLVKEEKGIYESTRLKKPVKMEETLSPLEQVIEKINEQYMGNFTEGDKVVITTLHQKLKNNKKLVKSAQTDGRQIFEKNIFPQLFDDAAQEAYSESIETYTKLFEDAGKYRAIMGALAHAMFEELQQRNI